MVLAHNGQPVLFAENELPLSLWCAKTKIPQLLKYHEFFADMHQAISDNKKLVVLAGFSLS